MLHNSKDTEHGSSNQEKENTLVFLTASSAVKNSRVVLVPCWTWKCAHTTSFGGVDISEVPGYQLL